MVRLFSGKIKKIITSAVLSVFMVFTLIPTAGAKVSADSFLALNTEFNIEGLVQAQAIAQIASAQLGLTGAELGAVEGWCADFIYSCAAAAGITSDIIPYTGDPTVMFATLVNNGAAIVTEGYQAGDIAFYPYQGGNGHVGLVVDENTVIHGNSNGADYLMSSVIATSVNYFADAVVVRPNYLVEDTGVLGFVTENQYLEYPDAFFWDYYMDEAEPAEDEEAEIDWQLKDGVLTIVGPEELADIEIGEAPWESVKDQITSVCICDTTKNIGANVFYGLTELTEVTFMSALESIGEHAFSGCEKLETVNYVGTEEEFNALDISDTNWELLLSEVKYHTLADEVIKENIDPSTCYCEGSHEAVWMCKDDDCGVELFRILVNDPVTLHTWGSSKVVTEPTDTADGLAEVYCKNCPAVKDVVIPSNKLKNISELEEGLMDYSLDGKDWYYIKSARVATELTTIAENANGVWYVKNGKVDFSKVGLVYFEDRWIYVDYGSVVYDYSGLADNEEGTWYMVNGEIEYTYTGVVQNGDDLWLVKEGRVADTYNGIAIYNSKVVWVIDGRITE